MGKVYFKLTLNLTPTFLLYGEVRDVKIQKYETRNSVNPPVCKLEKSAEINACLRTHPDTHTKTFKGEETFPLMQSRKGRCCPKPEQVTSDQRSMQAEQNRREDMTTEDKHLQF